MRPWTIFHWKNKNIRNFFYWISFSNNVNLTNILVKHFISTNFEFFKFWYTAQSLDGSKTFVSLINVR